MDDILSILHISDLHFSKSWDFRQNPVIQAFLRDVDQQITRLAKPDLLIFSGDLVQNPDEPDVYVNFMEFIVSLWQAIGIGEERTIFCPGNHDISFGEMRKNKLEYDGIHALKGSQNQLEAAFLGGKLTSYAERLSKPYFDFCATIGDDWKNPFYYVKHFLALDTWVVSLNTAVTCCLEGSAADRGQMAFPGTALEKAFNEIPHGARVLTVGHHPITDFTDAAFRKINSLIGLHSAIHFFGHLHDTRPQLQQSPSSNLLMVQAGPLYSDDGAIRSYQVIQLHVPSGKSRVTIRTYKEPRNEFDAGNEFAEKGTFPSDAETTAFWRTLGPTLNSTRLVDWLTKFYHPALQKEIGNGFGSQPLEEIYVFPPLARPEEDPDSSGRKIDVLVGSAALLNEVSNTLIFVPEEFGASSLLSYLALELTRAPRKTTTPAIPLLIDINHVRDYPAIAERVLKQAHPESDHEEFGWRSCVVSQPYLVLVDNFNPTNPAHSGCLARLYAVLPKARYIIAAKTQLALAGTSIPYSIDLPFAHDTLILRPFNRARLRELVRRWKLPPAFTENYVVDSIIQRFRSLSIPLSGPHICMFLTVLAAQKSFSPINASTVIELFVEALLDKSSPEKIYRTGMDFRETSYLLGHIAQQMVMRSDASLSRSEMETLIDSYYKQIGIGRRGSDVLALLVDANIISGTDEGLTFKYSVVYSFFIASRMKEIPEFREYVLSYDRFASFVHEIDLYCGLSRLDVRTLETVAQHHERAFANLDEQLRSFADYKRLVRLKLPHAKSIEGFTTEFARGFTDIKQKSTELDKVPIDASQFRQNLSRKKLENAVVIWIYAIRAYSVCLKNLEIIDSEIKDKHIANVLDAWSRLTAFAVAVAGICLQEDELTFSSFKFKLGLKNKLDGKIVRLMLMLIPTVIGPYVRSDLGSGKLTQQLSTFQASGNPISDLYRTGLLAAMKADGFMKYVKSYVRVAYQDEFLLGAMGFHLQDIFLRFGFAPDEEQSLKQTIAEIEADRRGLRGPERGKFISRLSADVSRRKMVENLRS